LGVRAWPEPLSAMFVEGFVIIESNAALNAVDFFIKLDIVTKKENFPLSESIPGP
jgi:hypothetical protein